MANIFMGGDNGVWASTSCSASKNQLLDLYYLRVHI
jgi:hypothetical protein